MFGLISLVKSLSMKFPNDAPLAIVLIALALCGFFCALLRRSSIGSNPDASSPTGNSKLETRNFFPALLFMLLLGVLFWPLTPIITIPQANTIVWSKPFLTPGSFWVAIAAVLCLLVYFFLTRNLKLETRNFSTETRNFLPYLAASFILASFFLFYDLSDFAYVLQSWEHTVVGEYAGAYMSGETISHYAARCLLWDNGVLSQGNTSLFFGVPTYVLFHIAGFSTWTLRFFAAFASLITIILMFLFAKRHFGLLAGTAMTVMLALNVCFIFYGRYGSSPAGMLLSLMLILLASWSFCSATRPSPWLVVPYALAFYSATLQYSPVRITLVYTLLFMVVWTVFSWKRLTWRHPWILVVLMLIATSVWYINRDSGRSHLLLNARSEQFFGSLEPVRLKEYLKIDVKPQDIDNEVRFKLLSYFVRTTVPQYLAHLLPSHYKPCVASEPIEFDLSSIYLGPLAAFIALGVVHSLRRWRSWKCAFLIGWVVFASIPLFMTNRVDSHRLMQFVVPLSIFAGLGIEETVCILRELRAPKVLLHVFGVLFILGMVFGNVYLLYNVNPLVRDVRGPARQVMEKIDGPLVFGVGMDSTERHWVQLQLLERTRKDPARKGTLLDNDLLHRLMREVSPENRIDAVNRVASDIGKMGTLVLVPYDSFRAAEELLKKKNLSIEVIRFGPSFDVLVIKPPAK